MDHDRRPDKRLCKTHPDPPEIKPYCTEDIFERCIRRSDAIEKARHKLSQNVEYKPYLDRCMSIISRFSDVYQYDMPLMVSVHALVMLQVLVSIIKLHLRDVGASYWMFVSMVCFKVSAAFHGPIEVSIQGMLEALKVNCKDEEKLKVNKRTYRMTEEILLARTNWSLFFPTPSDFCDFIKERSIEMVTPLGSIMSTCCSDHAVHGVLCLCLSKWEMLGHSFHAIAIAAIATILRLKSVPSAESGGDYPDDGMIENIMGYDSEVKGARDCARLTYYMVKEQLSAYRAAKSD